MRQRKLKAIFCLLFLMYAFLLYAQEQAPSEAGKPVSESSRLINLDVKEADIKDIMRMFSQVSGLNIIISDDVRASVTLSVTNVDWEDALNMILRTNNLISVKEGTFLRIMTYEKFRREEEGVPLVNETIFLNFVKAGEMTSILEPMRSGRGRITAHSQTNSLIISETPANFKKMLEVIEKLDKQTPQVMIEALMVDVKLTLEDKLGLDWTITHKRRPERSFTQDLNASSEAGVIRYGKTLLPKFNLTALIDFWCKDDKAEVLANPKVMTSDGLTATIELVEEVPYVQSSISETGSITSSYSFRSAGIKLDVTPKINKEGFISLTILTEQSSRSGTAGGQPYFDMRRASTNLIVKDQETIVIGGLRKRDVTDTIEYIPILGKIPLLGKFFQKREKSTTNKELLIFVTPYIITDAQLSRPEKRTLEKFKKLERGKKRDLGFLDTENPFSLRPPE